MTFVKGQSGNPAGRPKSKHVRDALLRAMEEAQRIGTPETWDDIARMIRSKAARGDLEAAKLLFERVDGKTPQPIAGDDDSDPITVRQIITGVPRAKDDR